MALRELAIQSSQLGRHEEALNLWKELLKLQPQSAEAHLNIGTACWNLARYAEAADFADKALQLDPTLKEARFNRAIALLLAGQGGRNQVDSAGGCGAAPGISGGSILALRGPCLSGGAISNRKCPQYTYSSGHGRIHRRVISRYCQAAALCITCRLCAPDSGGGIASGVCQLRNRVAAGELSLRRCIKFFRDFRGRLQPWRLRSMRCQGCLYFRAKNRWRRSGRRVLVYAAALSASTGFGRVRNPAAMLLLMLMRIVNFSGAG